MSQLWPGETQVPQLALQQICPELQVFGPQGTLSVEALIPHTACEHFCPGSTHVPQLALQHSLPSVQVVGPHGTSARAAALAALATGAGAGAGDDAAAAAVIGTLGAAAEAAVLASGEVRATGCAVLGAMVTGETTTFGTTVATFDIATGGRL